MKLNFQMKTPARCVYRVNALERYCTELLRSEPTVSQSSELIHFFIPKEEELHPEFAHNRYPNFYPDINNCLLMWVSILKNRCYIGIYGEGGKACTIMKKVLNCTFFLSLWTLSYIYHVSFTWSYECSVPVNMILKYIIAHWGPLLYFWAFKGIP